MHLQFFTCGISTEKFISTVNRCSLLCGEDKQEDNLPPWPSGLAISGRGAVKAWLAIQQSMGSYPTPAGMSSQVSA